MMSLSSLLADTPQRERAGERAQERFEFQALWGMALLFRQHDTTTNYAVIFEFHDDIALLDDVDDPTNVRFFQVKTKDKGIWTLADLKYRKSLAPKKKKKADEVEEAAAAKKADQAETAKPPQKGPSILGKMYHNVAQFGDKVASVTFVSNAATDLHEEQAFEFRECKPERFTALIEAIQAECDGATEDEIALFGYERSDLSVQDSATHMKGKLHEFVQKHAGASTFALDALFRSVAEECRKRSRFTGSAASYGEVVQLKGIKRAQVQEWLDAVRFSVSVPSWEELSGQLNYQGKELLDLRSAWSVYRAEALNQADEALRSIRRTIRERITEGFPKTHSVMDMIEETYASVEAVGRQYIAPFRSARLRAMIIYEIYTQDPS